MYRLRRRLGAADRSVWSALADGFCGRVESLVRRRSRISLSTNAVLGRRIRFAPKGRIELADGVEIGDDCTVGEGVSIGWRHRSYGDRDKLTRIGSGVTIAAESVILAGVAVGSGVKIGVRAVVDTDVPPGATVSAPQAKVLRPMRAVKHAS
jgi:serine O-acetyltransferase